MVILGIETSCDETGVAIYDQNKGLKAHQIYSQAKLHSYYGGVVPELASRNHASKIIPLIQKALKEAHMQLSDITGIAYTAGPGLINALMVGASVGRSLAYTLKVPSIGVNHMEAHLLTPMLEKNPPKFPFIALLVSGGHTQLIKAIGIGEYHLLGESIDDAVGEAFDKTAKLLGLNYPGGAMLSCLALKGIPGCYTFPRPMTKNNSLKFSFSGLKTFTANVIRNSSNDYQTRANIALAFENAVIETLVIKCKYAIEITNLRNLVIAGGVSANKSLRLHLKKMIKQKNGNIFYARPELCTDNGVMIAYTGMLRLQKKNKDDLNIYIRPKWPLEDLPKLNI